MTTHQFGAEPWNLDYAWNSNHFTTQNRLDDQIPFCFHDILAPSPAVLFTPSSRRIRLLYLTSFCTPSVTTIALGLQLFFGISPSEPGEKITF